MRWPDSNVNQSIFREGEGPEGAGEKIHKDKIVGSPLLMKEKKR